MVVAVARLTLMLHDNHSLKGKRKVVRSLIERVKHRFDAAIAEVEDHDKWQRAQIGIALVGNDSTLLQARLDQIMRFMESQHLAEVIDSQVEICYLEG